MTDANIKVKPGSPSKVCPNCGGTIIERSQRVIEATQAGNAVKDALKRQFTPVFIRFECMDCDWTGNALPTRRTLNPPPSRPLTGSGRKRSTKPPPKR